MTTYKTGAHQRRKFPLNFIGRYPAMASASSEAAPLLTRLQLRDLVAHMVD